MITKRLRKGATESWEYLLPNREVDGWVHFCCSFLVAMSALEKILNLMSLLSQLFFLKSRSQHKIFSIFLNSFHKYMKFLWSLTFNICDSNWIFKTWNKLFWFCFLGIRGLICLGFQPCILASVIKLWSSFPLDVLCYPSVWQCFSKENCSWKLFVAYLYFVSITFSWIL